MPFYIICQTFFTKSAIKCYFFFAFSNESTFDFYIKGTKKCAKSKEKRIFFVKNLVVMMKIYTFASVTIIKVKQIVNNPLKITLPIEKDSTS